MDNELHEWNATEGFWFTEKGEHEQRTFVQHLRSQFNDFVDNFELWTDAQKEQWEKDHPEPENTESDD